MLVHDPYVAREAIVASGAAKVVVAMRYAVCEDPPDALGVLDARNHLELPAAALTGLDLDREYTLQGCIHAMRTAFGAPLASARGFGVR